MEKTKSHVQSSEVSLFITKLTDPWIDAMCLQAFLLISLQQHDPHCKMIVDHFTTVCHHCQMYGNEVGVNILQGIVLYSSLPLHSSL